MKRAAYWSIDHPKWTIVLTLAITFLFLIQFPKAIIDTDPENMLEEDQPDRVFYNQVKEDFGIHDLIVVGITDEKGIFTREALGRIARITEKILEIEGVIVQDVMSFTTTDNVTSSDGDLEIKRIMEEVPDTSEEVVQRSRHKDDSKDVYKLKDIEPGFHKCFSSQASGTYIPRYGRSFEH